MMNTQINNNFLILLGFKIFSKLLLGVSASWFIFFTAKASAGIPQMYFSSSNLPIDYSQCKEKANRAAKLVLSNVGTSAEDDGGFTILGRTAVTVASLICVETSPGTKSNFTVITSQSLFETSEAQSVLDRINQIVIEAK